MKKLAITDLNRDVFRLAVWSALVVACVVGCADALETEAQNSDRQAAQPSSWEGVWVAERTFGPHLRGPVSLFQAGGGWIARIQGESAIVNRIEAADGSIEWSFSLHQHGRFIGRQENAKVAVVGHWLQAPGTVENYPFATPVRLESSGGQSFNGHLVPYPQEVSLNIPLIARGPGSPESLDAESHRFDTFLRNPQRNLGVYFRIESAVVEGEEIRFFNGDGEQMVVAQGRPSGDRFSLTFPRFDETLDFTRRSRDNAPGFYPRRSAQPQSALLRPAQISDGWKTAAPDGTGLDQKRLLGLVNSIIALEPTALRQPYIHGLLVAHRGKLVVEEYFHGHHRDLTHDSRSAGKSLASALLGIAVHQGALQVDQPVFALFGGVDSFANRDPRKQKMTVRHLITMSSGFHCDDGNYDNPGNEDTMQSQSEQPDWYRYTLDLPMTRNPGEASVYCTAGLNLVGGAIRQATGKSLMRFFHEEFAEPLGISYYQMNLSPMYRAYMGGGIRLRPRDFLKLGQLYLNGGVWNEQRLVSSAWVRESAAPQASVNEPDDYGFAWWRRSYEIEDRSIDTYYASGNGGQLLFIVPELELVVLIQAGNYGDGRTRNEFRDRFMRESILPAALGSASD